MFHHANKHRLFFAIFHLLMYKIKDITKDDNKVKFNDVESV